MSFALYGHGMHEFILWEAEVGVRAATAWDDYDNGTPCPLPGFNLWPGHPWVDDD